MSLKVFFKVVSGELQESKEYLRRQKKSIFVMYGDSSVELLHAGIGEVENVLNSEIYLSLFPQNVSDIAQIILAASRSMFTERNIERCTVERKKQRFDAFKNNIPVTNDSEYNKLFPNKYQIQSNL